MATVVTIEIGGAPYRYADAPVEVATADGGWELIPGGVTRCDVDLAGEDSPGGASIEVDVFPLDLAELASLGHVLAGLPAEVAEVSEGTAWDEREILCVGTTSDLTYGELGVPMSCQIGATWEDQGQLPPAGHVITDATWGLYTPSAGAMGKAYPVVIGKPTSTPGYLVVDSDGIVLIAGHRVLATTVLARPRPGSGAWFAKDVVYFDDQLGQTCACIDCGEFTNPETIEYEINWSSSDGGHYPVTSSGCPRSVPDVALVLLSYSTLAVDRGAWRAASWAAPFKLDMYIAEAATPLDILRDAMRGMPGRIEAGPRGIRPVGTSVAEVPGDTVRLDLNEGTVDFDGQVHVTGNLPPASIVVRYKTDAIAKKTTAVAVLHIGQGPRAARRSETYGSTSSLRPAVEEVSAGHVCDPATASRIASSIARERASRRVLSFGHEAGAEPFASLAVGQRVQVDHTGLHLDAHPAVVEQVDPDQLGGTRHVTLRLIDDP